MDPKPADPGEPPPGYIRGVGARGVQVSGRRVALIGIGLCAVVLAVLVVVLAVDAVHQNSRINRLRQHGVAVQVTVTSCLGQASGTGITESGFTCRGTFTLDGQLYNEVIGVSSSPYPVGETVPAVALAADPSVVSSAAAVARMHASWRPFLTPGILLLVLLALLAGLFGWLRIANARGWVSKQHDPDAHI